jgi:DNA mismatch endonuclease (patch repair protein)
MARVRSKNTDAELALRRSLWGMGLRYRLHSKLPGTPDIVFRGPKLAVFIDGCFWHGCPVHYSEPASNVEFWKAKRARNATRDARVDAELHAAGWTVLRIWEHEVRADPDAAAARVALRIQAAPVRNRTPMFRLGKSSDTSLPSDLTSM